jgi:hypothetical protein
VLHLYNNVRLLCAVLRRDFQAIDKRADPDHESHDAHADIEPALKWAMQCGQGQRRSQCTMEGSTQQTAESDKRGSAAKGKPGDDDDKTEAEHG